MIAKKTILSMVAILLLYSTLYGYEFEYSSEIFLDEEPVAVAVNPATDTAAVLGKGGRNLAIIDLGSNAVLHEVALPKQATALAIYKTPNHAVLATADGSLLLYNLASGSQAGAVEIGGPVQALEINEFTGSALVGTEGGVRVIDLSTLSLLPEVIQTGDTAHLCAGKSTSLAVSIEEERTKFFTLHLASREITSVTSLNHSVSSIALDELNNLALVTLEGESGLLLFDLVSLDFIDEVAIESPASLVSINPSTRMAFLSGASEGTLTVVDLEHRKLLETISLFESPGPLSIDPTRNLALVGHDTNLSLVQLENPIPQLDGMVPEQATAGEGGVTLSLKGARFTRDSQTHFGSRIVPTEFETNEELKSNIPPSELQLPGEVSVAVQNPPPGGGFSNPLGFRILNPMPEISGISPSTMAVNSEDLSIRVEGENFLPASVLRLNGEPIETGFISSIVLEGTVKARHLTEESAFWSMLQTRERHPSPPTPSSYR